MICVAAEGGTNVRHLTLGCPGTCRNTCPFGCEMRNLGIRHRFVRRDTTALRGIAVCVIDYDMTTRASIGRTESFVPVGAPVDAYR
jgi:hypothetical protein